MRDWLRRSRSTPTIFSTCTTLRAITIQRRDWNAFRLPSLQSIRRTTSAILQKLEFTERELKRIKDARLLLIPGSEETLGHATTLLAKFWKQPVQELLQTAPQRRRINVFARIDASDALQKRRVTVAENASKCEELALSICPPLITR